MKKPGFVDCQEKTAVHPLAPIPSPQAARLSMDSSNRRSPAAGEILKSIIDAIMAGKGERFLDQLTCLPNFDVHAVHGDRPYRNKSVLAIAAERNDVRLCQYFLKKGADPGGVDQSRLSPRIRELLRAAQEIRRAGFKPKGRTLNMLEVALSSYDVQGMRDRLEHEVKAYEGRRLPFSRASVQRYLEIAHDRNRPDMTCAILALDAAFGHSENHRPGIPVQPPATVQRVSLVEKNWERQLYNAVEKGMTDVLERLPTPNAMRYAGFATYMRTALDKAMEKEKDSPSVVRILLNKGATVADGATPLHLAVRKGNLEVVGFLLRNQE